MTAKVLDSFAQFCKQESTGVFLMQGGKDRALNLQESATLSHGSDPEGIEFYVRVQYASAAASVEWENMVASYTFDGTNYRLERQRTLAGSSGSTSIDFSSVDESLIVIGISSSELFNDDVRILQSDLLQDFTDYTITSTSDLSQTASATLSITPKSSSSILIVRYSSNIWANSNISAQNDIRPKLSFSYNTSSGFVSFSSAHLLGQVISGSGSADEFLYQDPNMVAKFTQAQLAPSGDWEIKMLGNVDFANTTMIVNNTFFDYREQV